MTSTKDPAARWLQDVVERNRQKGNVGLFSVCSAHPQVLHAAMRHTLASGSMLCVESTSNQVNQFGGYTGLTPARFVEYLHSIADRESLQNAKLMLGDDHIVPYP